MTDASKRLAQVRDRIAAACERSGRSPSDVLLLGVSKTHPAATIRELADLGVAAFGESYVAEWQRKADELADVTWHFVGHLQSRKAKHVAGRVALLHSVDRDSVVAALDRAAPGPIDVLLQVNVGLDAAKSGVEPSEMIDLLALTTKSQNLRVRGLMTMPPWTDDPEDARPHFRALAALHAEARHWLDGNAPDVVDGFTELSMGMSGDLEVAIEEGATIVRVGTALMGPRS